MQVSAARKSTEGGEGSLKKFTGVASLYVKSFNPSKAELEAMGMKAEQEPVYLLKDENGKVTGVRFAFLLEGKHGDDLIRSTVNLFIRIFTKFLKINITVYCISNIFKSKSTYSYFLEFFIIHFH